MKKIISLILAVMMIFTVIPANLVFAEEKVVFTENFENGIDFWKLSSNSEGKYTIDKSTFSEGKASLKVTDNDEVNAIGLSSVKFAVEPNTTYKFTFDFYNLSGKAVFVYLRAYDAKGNRILSKGMRGTAASWESVIGEAEMPPEAVDANIFIAGSSTALGEAYVDNIVVTKGKTTKPVEIDKAQQEKYEKEGLVFFDNFENGIGSWKYDNQQSEGRIYLETSLYSEGKACVRVKDDELEKAIGLVSSKFPVVGGETYTLVYDSYVFSGKSVRVTFRAFDEKNTRVLNTSYTGKGRKWTLATLGIEVPATAVTAELVISAVSTSQGDACVDNLRVYKGAKTVTPDFSNSVADSEKTKEYTFPDVYEMPEFKPTIGHPRVYFNKDDIETIKKNATHPENASAYAQLLKDIASESNGSLPSVSGDNLNGKLMGVIQSKAFYYAIWGDEAKGREAVSMLNNFLNDANPYDSEYNNQGFLVFTIAVVYDWCYPLLTEEHKKFFTNMGLITASTMEIGFPPAGGSVFNAHSAEAQLQRDQMAFAIAVYDERPDIYKNVAGRYFSEMVNAKKFLASAKSSMFGNSYANYRYQWEVISVFMMDALGIPYIYGEDHGQVLYWNLYARRPDGSMLHDGDSVSQNQAMGPYDERGTKAFFLAGNCYKDPYLKGEALRHNNGLIIGDVSGNQTLSAVEVLCFNDPSVSYKSVKELPLSMYYPSPRGEMIARTGWEDGIKAPSVVAQMKIDEYWTQGHDHLDAGEFEIYYKGALANDTGYYQAGRQGSVAENSGNTVSGTVHFNNYQRRTIAHNCIVVFDPNENIQTSYKGYANDGGQIYANGEGTVYTVGGVTKANHVGQVLGREIGTDTIQPDYTYLKGDIGKAYGDKVSEYERSFMFLNLKNSDTPAAMIVFDRVKSKDKSFDKKWILHGLHQPEINGTRSVFKDTRAGYNGKMTVDTLLPKVDNVDIKAVGGQGQEYLVNGVDYWAQPLAGAFNEGGGYRIEVSPKADNEEDYFLNVIQVADANTTADPLASEIIEGTTHTGVKVADRVVMFGNEKDRVSGNVNFTVAGDGWFKHTVADLKEGTWKVTKDGADLCEIVATKDGGVGSFEAGAGAFTLSYLGAYGEKSFTATPNAYTEGINLKLEPANKYIYSDVEPFTVNGRTLVPLRAIFEALEAKVTWDEATATATGEKDGTVIKITENSEIAYVNGSEYKLDAPAMVKYGRFVVPVRFVAESFGVLVEWDDFSKTVIIKTSKNGPNINSFAGNFVSTLNIPNALPICMVEQSGDDGAGDNILLAFDNSLGTNWAVKEDEKGNPGYGIFDLGSVKTIDAISTAYMKGTERVYTFSVYVSEDGKNYTLVKENLKSSGKTMELETYELGGVKGRYVKYVGHGNTTNTWNSITEIVISGK